MDKRLQKLLNSVNALPEQFIPNREYEPVSGTLTAFKNHVHVEDFDFTEGIPLKAGEVIRILTEESAQELIDTGKIREIVE